MPAERFLRHRGLIALAIGGAVAEACLLTIFAPAARPIAPQITALPPLGIFHDLRWLFGYNRSWYGFDLAYAGLVFGRAAISTAAIRLAWPRHLGRPAWAATFGRCVIFTVVAGVLLSPVITLLFGVSLLPFSWPFLAALPAMLLILIPLTMWVPLYNRVEPTLWGFPFFYWFQLLGIVIGALLTALAYFVTEHD